MEANRFGKSYDERKNMIAILALTLLLFFVGRLFFLQVMSDDYKKWADSNAFQKRVLYPSRGVIYDRTGKLLVFNQPSHDVMIVMREVQPFDTLDFCQTLNITKDNFNNRIAKIKNKNLNPGYSSYVPQLFISQIPAEEYGVFQEKLYKFPGFYIRNRTLRDYGYTNAANILGNVGEVNRNDIKKDDYYVQGDNSGRAGVERSYEKILRGEKGVEVLLRDVHGRIKGKYKDGKSDVSPVSGKNIKLSIDLDLQAYGEMLMQDKLGAIVMIEPSTGEILCLVSSPSYDPNLLVGRRRGDNHKLLERNPLKPLFDRSIMGAYPPGSTFKPAQGLIFLQEKVIDKETAYSCAGGYTYLRGRPGCHPHYSPTSIIPALSTSCNSFFCWGLHDMLDDRSRYPSVQEAYEVWKDYIVAMGYGYTLNVDLPGEKRGYIPNSKVYDKIYNKRWTSSTIISIAIGQGEINTTPLQMCNLAATIANRGYYIIPHVVSEIQNMPLEEKYTTKKHTDIDSEYYDYIVDGMRSAVTGGTCRRMALPDIEVCGKTGTIENAHGRDHSSCIGFAPKENPKVAISVYVENGGFGASLAVPIAKLMFQKYFYGEIPKKEKWMENRIIKTNTIVYSNKYIGKTKSEEENKEEEKENANVE